MPQQPKYCHHKATNQAFVRIDGRMHSLGEDGSAKSRDAYDRLILTWRQQHLSGKHSTTGGQLCLAFMEHADQFYRDPEGNPTGEANNFRKALRPLAELFRALPCSEFGPLKLKQVQQELSQKHVRSQVNKNISRIKSVFRWGVAHEMVPAEILIGLDCVKGLKQGRCQAQEGKPVLPVPESDFETAVAKMSPNVAAICRLLYLTGARVSEIRLMRVGDIDTSGDVWI